LCLAGSLVGNSRASVQHGLSFRLGLGTGLAQDFLLLGAGRDHLLQQLACKLIASSLGSIHSTF